MTTCRHCGNPYANPRPRRHGGNYAGCCGYCPACYRRWASHGFPESGPPPQRTGTGPKAGRDSRIEDYLFLRQRGLSRAEAALRLGLTRRTLHRYDAGLRAGAA
jgi:hypothetical protein